MAKKEINIYKVISNIHKTAEENGFWDSMDVTIEKMDEAYSETSVRGGRVFTDYEIDQVKKAFISQKLMLISSEIGEALESLRENKRSNFVQFSIEYFKEIKKDTNEEGAEQHFVDCFQFYMKDTFEDELADTVIRIFDLCAKLKIDIIGHMLYKMDYNKTREKLHGKEF